MPSGQNSVHGPASMPVFDPKAVRGDRIIYRTSGFDLPPFHVAGAVNTLAQTTGYPSPRVLVLSSATVTVRDAGGTSVTFVIKVNGVTIDSHTIATSGLFVFAQATNLAVNDVVTMEITDFGTGALQDLLVVLRVDDPSAPLCLQGVMGSVSWETMTSLDPSVGRLEYDVAGDYYFPNNQAAQTLQWPDTIAGTQSIEATFDNFGTWYPDAPQDEVFVALECRRPNSIYNDTGLQFLVIRTNPAIPGGDFFWRVDFTDDTETSLYAHPSTDLVWPYDPTLPFTARLESDEDGAFRAYINDVLLWSDVVPGQPVGATKVGLWMETSQAGSQVVPVQATAPRITDICIMDPAAPGGALPGGAGDGSGGGGAGGGGTTGGAAAPDALALAVTVPSPFAAPAVIALRATVPSPSLSSGAGAGTPGTSLVRIGWVHTQQDTKPPGSSRLATLADAAPVQGQHMQGFGAGLIWPTQAGAKKWDDMDRIFGPPGRPDLGYMRDATQRVLYLLACPAWMKVPVSGTSLTQLYPLGDPTHEYTPYEPPHVSHYPTIASLGAAIVTRYSQITHVVVWNEGKGFFVNSLNRWDYAGYTNMYNQCYAAIKAARADVKVGGPYFVLRTLGWSDRAHWSSELNGPWGHADTRIIDVMKYFLTHATDADFFAMDLRNSNSDYAQNDFDAPTFDLATWRTNPERGVNPTYWPINPWRSWSKLADIMTWYHSQPRLNNLPFYFMELYANALVNNFNSNFPTHPESSLASMASVAAEGMKELALQGFGGSLFWRPDGDSRGRANPLALYNSSAFPTLMAPVCRAMKEHFGPGVAIHNVTGLPSGITAIGSPTHAMLISANSGSTSFTLDGSALTLSGYEVRLVTR